MKRHAFKRDERLKSEKTISSLFSGGHSFVSFPVRLVWKNISDNNEIYPARFAVSVSKKRFKRAVKRNRIKRLVREAYRLNKHLLYQHLNHSEGKIALMMIYVAQEEMPFDKIESAVIKALKRLVRMHKSRGAE